jgi:hypothetical protein
MQRERQSWEAELQLKSLLREYLEERQQVTAPRYDFLPSFGRESSLPIDPIQVSWTRTDDSSRSIRFDRRSDLQDFVNCYLELEEEMRVFATLKICGNDITISSDEPLEARFKMMIDEIAHETRGY